MPVIRARSLPGKQGFGRIRTRKRRTLPQILTGAQDHGRDDRNPCFRVKGTPDRGPGRPPQSRSSVRSAALTRSSSPAPTDGSLSASRDASRASPGE